METSGMANTLNRRLEVTVISGEDLRINDRPIKNNAFVTVKADCGSPWSHDSTKPDDQGESYPYWDEKLHVDLPAGSRHLVVEVLRRSSSAGDRPVGTAWIPVSDFIYTDYPRFLSYRLRDAKGLRNGIINISVRVLSSSCKGSSLCKGCSSSSSPSVPEFGMPADQEKNSGTVTGVPVWFSNRWKT